MHLPHINRSSALDGLTVDFIDQGQRTVYVDETVLPAYDLVVSIGKTVPYALAQRVPVYYNDHFGGPGYLDAHNFERARHGNFCGRAFWRTLNAAELYADIKAGHAAATGAPLDFLQARARSLFSLETNLERMCAELASMPETDLDALRRRHALAGRLNDVYMDSLRHRMGLEASLRSVNEAPADPAGDRRRSARSWWPLFGKGKPRTPAGGT